MWKGSVWRPVIFVTVVKTRPVFYKFLSALCITFPSWGLPLDGCVLSEPPRLRPFLAGGGGAGPSFSPAQTLPGSGPPSSAASPPLRLSRVDSLSATLSRSLEPAIRDSDCSSGAVGGATWALACLPGSVPRPGSLQGPSSQEKREAASESDLAPEGPLTLPVLVSPHKSQAQPGGGVIGWSVHTSLDTVAVRPSRLPLPLSPGPRGLCSSRAAPTPG